MDEDSNVLRGRTASEVAVAIRKPAGAGNGYRKALCAVFLFRAGHRPRFPVSENLTPL